MNSAQQQEQQQTIEAPAPDREYDWSTTRVAEGVTTNVVSFLLIGICTIIGGMFYAGWILLLTVLHVPDGIIGLLAFVLLGAMLMLVILAVTIIAWFRGMSTGVLLGLLIGAVVGAAIGAALEKGEWKLDWAKFAATQEQQKAAQQKASSTDER